MMGVPWDRTGREDLNVTLPAGKRRIGGPGIFLMKQLMDGVSRTHRKGKSTLTLKKNL